MPTHKERMSQGALEIASPDDLGWFAKWVVGWLVGVPLFRLGALFRIWPGERLLSRIAFYVVCRTRLPNNLWTLYTSPGEPDYALGKADDPTRRERASITATYNALDAIKAANSAVPWTLHHAVCYRFAELQDPDLGYWGNTYKSLEGGVASIAGIPRHTAMAVATICEFGNFREFDELRLHAAVRWLVRTSRLKSGGWSYSQVTGKSRHIGALTTAAVIRALHEYRSALARSNSGSSRTRYAVSIEELDDAICHGLEALLGTQADGLWDCRNDASQLANRYRDGLSILRWIGPAVKDAGAEARAQDAASTFIKACEDAQYDRSRDPAAHPVAVYLGCLDLRRSYGISGDTSITPALLQSIRVTFSTDELSHWDWQRCCIGICGARATIKQDVSEEIVLLDTARMKPIDRFRVALWRSYVRRTALFPRTNPLILKGIFAVIFLQGVTFILGLIADANDWKNAFTADAIRRMWNSMPFG